jgi:hypothetical protein
MPDKTFKGFSDGREERERESMRQKIQTWKIHLFIIITRTLKPHHCNTDRIPLRTELCPDRPPLPCLPPSIVFLPLSSSSLQPNLHAPYLHTSSSSALKFFTFSTISFIYLNPRSCSGFQTTNPIYKKILKRE